MEPEFGESRHLKVPALTHTVDYSTLLITFREPDRYIDSKGQEMANVPYKSFIHRNNLYELSRNAVDGKTLTPFSNKPNQPLQGPHHANRGQVNIPRIEDEKTKAIKDAGFG